ncbi:histidine ABC transporter permease HisM [Basilea psittacipulmonis]|uniref:Amino acid ABC transporter permease n=1 Tax=Basilea psittacipulmonis DSM 24701 TaxID=1072685 RepID=A0A077DDQ9_9BURK|nr:histidine ABC transporter permease HisM [Basilea psittacipulmonis]AIL32734.1 amino acid ABC transporter permease [Basilea psittacipulmonis DSM 24701]
MLTIWLEYWRQYLGVTDNISGVAMTLWITILSVMIGTCFAIPLSICQASKNKFLRWPVLVYTFVFRGTPLYVQLLIIYTGIFSLVKGIPYLDDFFKVGFNCTILAFTLNTCAYMVEILSGAIRQLPQNEIEAAQAYGFSKYKIYRYIILPSAIKRSLPLYTNEIILVLHATSLAFTASVPEILKVARDVNSATYDSFSAFGIAAILYAIISFILVGIFRVIEKRQMKFLNRDQGSR